MRYTSIAAYNAILPTIGARQIAVLQAVCTYPDWTAMELERRTRNRHLNKRLIELLRYGLITNGMVRPCRCTGHDAVTWVPVAVVPSPAAVQAAILALRAQARHPRPKLSIIEKALDHLDWIDKNRVNLSPEINAVAAWLRTKVHK